VMRRSRRLPTVERSDHKSPHPESLSLQFLTSSVPSSISRGSRTPASDRRP
jgi:hypothetical protein